ncbi:MAG: four helix bundle protein [Pyrinomonadaceae bacterium]
MNDEDPSNKVFDLRIRTKRFALRIITLYRSLPKDVEAQIIGRQVLRSGTSVGAQYREGHRARSTAEFISKLESAAQELDETMYWFELLVEGGIIPEAKLAALQDEADQLMAILVTSIKRAKSKR